MEGTKKKEEGMLWTLQTTTKNVYGLKYLTDDVDT